MKYNKFLVGAALLALLPVTVHAESAEDRRIDRLEAQLQKLRFERSQDRKAVQQLASAPVPVPVIVPPRPYDWTGFYIGGDLGASVDDHNPIVSAPTYGNLQGNDIGFGSNGGNGYNVDSQTYNALANGTNSNGNPTATPGQLNGPYAPGYTSYSASAFGQGYTTSAGNGGAGNGSIGLGQAASTNNGSQQILGQTSSFASVTPYNNLSGDRSDSVLTQHSNARRLLGAIGGDIGYRHQFGLFVVGIEADGGYLDGKRTQTSNSTGQFSNSQGAATNSNAGECSTAIGGNGDCTGAVQNASTGYVNVNNNGNSSFQSSVQAGPQWLGTARLSAGVSVDRVLLYATGGLAYGQSDLAASATYHDTANSVCSGSANGTSSGVAITGSAAAAGSSSVGYSCNGGGGSSFTYSNAAQWIGNRSKFMTGVAVGGGAAFAITDNVVFKIEGIYYNLGSIGTTVYGSGTQTLTVNQGNAPTGTTPGTRAASVSSYYVNREVDGFLGKVGVAYKFNTGEPDPIAVVARY